MSNQASISRRAAARLGYLMVESIRRLPPAPRSRSAHLQATLDWLLRAHDAAGDGGVSAGYQPARRQWFSSYPETTGYIIPTLLRLAARFEMRGEMTRAAELRRRAVRMGEWEIEVQMPGGCVQADYWGAPPRPAVFNTGQVLFGWCALHDDDHDPRWLAPARRAVDWLLMMQEPDGSWRRGQSPKAPSPVHTYDVRVAWSLLEFHRITRQSSARAAAERSADWAVSRQEPDGWYADTSLGDRDTPPTTHPIGYVLEGLLACHLHLSHPRYLESARRAVDRLLAHQSPDGRFPGAFARAWRPSGRSSCLTGNAQIAIACGWLHVITGEPIYLDALRRANRFVARTQLLDDPDPGIRGGVKGSHPNTTGYSPFFYPNWAAKFFLDALILEESLEGEDASALRARLPWCG